MLIGTWDPGPPPAPRSLVVAAPHPDDECLGAGAIMRWCQHEGAAVTVVGCTDGEASHARSTAVTADELRDRRRAERAQALEGLGLIATVHELHLPDGALAGHVPGLTEALVALAPAGTTLLVPWDHDDHPDHRSVAAAGMAAAARTGATLWRSPVWGKVRPDRPFEGRWSTLVLDEDARIHKATAVRTFTSQLQPVGPGAYDGPVVHPDELDRMLDGTEVLLW